jgi:cell division protein ZipA
MDWDADTIRLLLLLLGVVLVAGIYGWDRYKRIHWRMQATQRQRERARRQPRFDESDGGNDAEEIDSAASFRRDEHPEEGLAGLRAEDPDTLLLTEADTSLKDEDGEGLAGFSARETADALQADELAGRDLPRKLLVINLVTKSEHFEGTDILRAAGALELEPGAMDIFHRYDAKRPDMVLFSMASMVEPGSFPFEQMEAFRTPGLTLFSQLPGVRDGVQIYSEMLFTAQRLVAILGGVLQDETHSVLTKQTIEHTRDEILEYRRQLQLAMRR